MGDFHAETGDFRAETGGFHAETGGFRGESYGCFAIWREYRRSTLTFRGGFDKRFARSA
jgi:hypothetical protein